MIRKILKNIDAEKVLNIADMVQYQEGQIVSRTLVQNGMVSITLFAFDTNEEISSHASKGDAMITVLEGRARITIGDNQYVVEGGQTIVMPNNVPHAVMAVEPFKMQLTVVFPLPLAKPAGNG